MSERIFRSDLGDLTITSAANAEGQPEPLRLEVATTDGLVVLGQDEAKRLIAALLNWLVPDYDPKKT